MHLPATDGPLHAAAAGTAIPDVILDQAVDIHSVPSNKQLGSGFVINREWVLSARHLYVNETRGPCTPNVSRFLSGASVSGKWWRGWKDSDLAVLRLSKRISATETPIEDVALSVEMTGVVVGYGKGSGQLEVRHVRICDVKPKRVRVEVTDSQNLLCYGDSGGALFVERDGSYVLTAVMIENGGRLLKLLFDRIAHFFGYPADDCFERAWCRRIYPYKALLEGAMSGGPLRCKSYFLRRLLVKLLSHGR